ncbi:MAG TPA: hypothetical protein PLI18_10335, partial [Pirellulaceae bacterium]|nr:hypothetical protein [Pirellulaceae bacterium]
RLIPALRFGLVVSVRTRGSGELLTAPRPPSPKRQAQGHSAPPRSATDPGRSPFSPPLTDALGRSLLPIGG